MKKLRIHFVLPGPAAKPGGGTKIMYEYANRLALLGHEVHIYLGIAKPYRQMRSPVWFKWLKAQFTDLLKPGWFKFNEGVKKHIVPDITDRYLPDADIVIGTWWEMAYRINELSPAKGKKFNLIQDFELWCGFDEMVINSYRLPINHLVIARYLQDKVKEASGKTPVLLPNAINQEIFKISKPIAERKANTLIMLYSEESRKGSAYGLAAIRKVKAKIKDLKLILFSTFPKPNGLEEWIEFHQKPANLPELYNEAKLFVSPSLGEGWALPPAEAMACGCAVVCTDIGGHADYAIHQETALLVKTENTTDLEEKLLQLLQNDEQRLQLAYKSHSFITQNYNWDKSVAQLAQLFLKD